jgi:hypothetical protein
MSSEEKQPVACSRRSLFVQDVQLILKALPLRQRMAFRNGRVRIIGPFDKAKVGSCLMRVPLANVSTRDTKKRWLQACLQSQTSKDLSSDRLAESSRRESGI